MKAEIAVMTEENIDRKAIARGGEILKNDLCSQGKTFRQSADRTYRRYP